MLERSPSDLELSPCFDGGAAQARGRIALAQLLDAIVPE
jgi:hypothetical protein